MTYLFDTNICIFLINRKPETVFRKLRSVPLGEIGISSVSVSELLYGVAKSAAVEKNQAALEKFLLPLDILPYDALAAEHYGPLRAYLESRGTPIGPMDLMIAAHALSQNLMLVTNNLKEFKRVPGLRVEDWATV